MSSFGMLCLSDDSVPPSAATIRADEHMIYRQEPPTVHQLRDPGAVMATDGGKGSAARRR